MGEKSHDNMGNTIWEDYCTFTARKCCYMEDTKMLPGGSVSNEDNDE